MRKLTWDELTARINKSTSVSEINRLNKKRKLIEDEVGKQEHEQLEQDVHDGKLCKDDSGRYF